MTTVSAIERLGASWRQSRLDVASLPAVAQCLSVLAIGLAVALSAEIVAEGLGGPLVGGMEEEIPRFGALSHVVLALWFVGLAVGAALLAAAALEPLWKLPKLTLVLLGLLGASTGAGVITVAQDLGYSTALLLGGWPAVAAGGLLASIPTRVLRRRKMAAVVLAAAPFLLGLAAFILAGDTEYRVSSEIVAANPSWPDIVTLRGVLATEVIEGSSAVAVAVDLLLIWQVVELARFWRDGAAAVNAVAGGVWAVLALLLAAKLVWLGLGYAGAFPPSFAEGAWAHSLADGVVSWLLAVAIALGLVWALLRVRIDPQFRKHAARATLVAVGVIVVGPIVAGLLYTSAVLSPLWGSAGEAAFVDASNLVSELIPLTWVALPYLLAGFAAAVLFRGYRTLAVLLLIFAAWSVPRALFLTSDLVRYPALDLPVASIPDFVEGEEQVSGWVDLVTIDAAVTIALVIVGASWWARRRTVAPASVLVILLISTVAAYWDIIIPSETREVFYALLVFPVLYTFLFDADVLNEPGPSRSGRVLAALGATVLVLTVTALRVANGAVRPGGYDYSDLGAILLLAPLVAVLTAGLVLAPRRSIGMTSTP
jgi:hypothetical protein